MEDRTNGHDITPMQTTVHRIRQEFERPFREVVEQFAADGYSKRATAQILDVSLSQFRTLIVRYAPEAHWKYHRELRRECRSCGMNGGHQTGGWKKGKKRLPEQRKPRKYTDEQLFDMLRKYPHINGHDWNQLGPCSITTITRRFGTWNKARALAGLTGIDITRGGGGKKRKMKDKATKKPE